MLTVQLLCLKQKQHGGLSLQRNHIHIHDTFPLYKERSLSVCLFSLSITNGNPETEDYDKYIISTYVKYLRLV